MSFKYGLLGIIFLSTLLITQAQSKLEKADSLFAKEKYTEAYQLYDEIFQGGHASEAMLLKMAFIKEGLQDYANALIYLNLYYKKSSDRKTWAKINELANANELAGYVNTDKDFFFTLAQKYRNEALIGLILISSALLLHLYFKRRRREPFGINIFFQVLTMAFLVLVANNYFMQPKAIIVEDSTLLMSAPSAAGEPVEVINKGHKVTVLEQDEIWVKILWDGEEVFLRQGKIARI